MITIKPAKGVKFITPEQAREMGCDCCQVKHDGEWTEVLVTNGHVESRYADRTLAQRTFGPGGVWAILEGNIFHGPKWMNRPDLYGKTVIFDIFALQVDGAKTEITALSYRNRYALARNLVAQMGSDFIMVKNYPIAKAEEVWDKEVVGTIAKGLIFRKSTSPGRNIWCQRYYPDIPGDPAAVKALTGL